MLLDMGDAVDSVLDRFMKRSVTIGFTNGIALLIASTQIKDFLGLRTPAVPSDFLPRLKMLGEYVGTANFEAIAVAGCSVCSVLPQRRFTRRIPGSIVA